MSEPALRWAAPADTPALLALFQRTFGSEMSVEEWRWKYPQPADHSLVAWRNGQALAHYGGQPRRLAGLGAVLTGMQVSDSMVDPAERSAGGRKGLFARIARPFTQAVTAPEGPHAFTFGFPSPRASRLGELLGMYERLDRLDQLRWPAAGRAGRLCVHACDVAALLALAARLWYQQEHALGATYLLGVRDAHWLQARYLARPGVRYEALCYHNRWRRLDAGLVFRAHTEVLELVDLLGHPAGYAELLRALTACAAERGKQAVLAWLTPAAQAALPPPAHCETVLPVNIAGPQAGAQVQQFASRCWMTAGDTDYR